MCHVKDVNTNTKHCSYDFCRDNMEMEQCNKVYYYKTLPDIDAAIEK